MDSRRVLLLCAIASATAAACAGLKAAEISVTITPEGGTPPNGVDDDAATSDDVPEPPDAGTPPDDFECDHDPWTETDKSRAECAPRRVMVVSPAPAILASSVSIARTAAGRIGIAWNADETPDTARLRVAHFRPATPNMDAPVVIERDTPDFFHTGDPVRIAASGKDTLSLLSFDWSSDDGAGSVNVVKVVDGATKLTEPELVVDGVKAPTELGYAIDGAGTSYAIVRMQTTDTKAKLTAFSQAPGQPWAPIADVPSMGLGLLPKEAPGTGASSLFIAPTNRLHLLYHHNESINASAPRYHELAGPTWTYRKTVDNNVPDGWCGFSPRVVVFGNRKYALYFYRKVAQDTPTPTAELRLATWVNEDDEPSHEVIDQKIPAVSAQAPRYRAAMAVDKYGLIHLAIIRPDPNENAGFLEYRRQQRVEGGGTRWLSDIVDPTVLADNGVLPWVDMVVDEDARPHIAYLSGVDQIVRYATRYDR